MKLKIFKVLVIVSFFGCFGRAFCEILQPGIYLPTSEASELRLTGMLNFLCKTIVETNALNSSAVLIDSNGNTFGYDPYLKSDVLTPVQTDLSQFSLSSREEVQRDFSARHECFQKNLKINQQSIFEEAVTPIIIQQAQEARHFLSGFFIKSDSFLNNTFFQDSDELNASGFAMAVGIASAGGTTYSYIKATQFAAELKDFDLLAESALSIFENLAHLAGRPAAFAPDFFAQFDSLKEKMKPKFNSKMKIASWKKVGTTNIHKFPIREPVHHVLPTFKGSAGSTGFEFDRMFAKFSSSYGEYLEDLRNNFIKASLTKAQIGVAIGATLFVASVALSVYSGFMEYRKDSFQKQSAINYMIHSREGLIEFLNMPDVEAEKLMMSYPQLTKFVLLLQQQFSNESGV